MQDTRSRAQRRATRAVLATCASVALLGSACRTDGPVGFVPGGLFAGAVERGAEPDWSFAAELDSVDVQVGGARPRTVRTGIVVYEGVPHLPVTWSPLKRWPEAVRSDPRVLVRAADRHFERRAVWIDDPEELARLRAAGHAKYGPPFHARATTNHTFYFRLEPPQENAAGS